MIAEKRLRDARWVVRWHVITYQTKKNFENLSGHFVPSLHFVPGLQSASCAERIGIAVSVRASLKSEPKYWSSKKTLLRPSWPLWLICGLFVEELTRKCTGMEQWLISTNWRRTQMCGLPLGPLWCSFAWSQRELKWTRYGSSRCEHFGFSTQVAFSEVRKCYLRLLFFLLNHINISFRSTWISELHRN